MILDQRQNSGDEIPGQKPHSSSMCNDRILLRSKISGKKAGYFIYIHSCFIYAPLNPKEAGGFSRKAQAGTGSGSWLEKASSNGRKICTR